MTDPARPDWLARLARLRGALAAAGAGAVVISTPNNIAYLSGFVGSAGVLLVSPTAAILLTDGRYAAIVRAQIADGTMAPIELSVVELGYDRALFRCVELTGVRRIGFESGHVTVATLDGWRNGVPKVDWVGTSDLVETQRVVKDDVEVAILRRAGTALSGVALRLRQFVRVGDSERVVAGRVNRAIEEAGFERPAFETIVASGPNSAYPHARPSNRPIQDNEIVLLDFGGVLDGYCVDLTRVFVIGHANREIRSLYDAVRAAHGAALAASRAGVLSSEVDRAARSVLDARGYGAAFSHGTGHGLGRDVHEAPRITRAESAAPVVLERGMVFTVEPGAYVEGLGGIRLEDDVLVAAEGCEVLTNAPCDLLVV